MLSDFFLLILSRGHTMFWWNFSDVHCLRESRVDCRWCHVLAKDSYSLFSRSMFFGSTLDVFSFFFQPHRKSEMSNGTAYHNRRVSAMYGLEKQGGSFIGNENHLHITRRQISRKVYAGKGKSWFIPFYYLLVLYSIYNVIVRDICVIKFSSYRCYSTCPKFMTVLNYEFFQWTVHESLLRRIIAAQPATQYFSMRIFFVWI